MDDSLVIQLNSADDLKLINCSLPLLDPTLPDTLLEEQNVAYDSRKAFDQVLCILRANSIGDGRIIIDSSMLFSVCDILCESTLIAKQMMLVSVLKVLRKWRVLPLDHEQRAASALAATFCTLRDSSTAIEDSPKGLRVRWLRKDTSPYTLSDSKAIQVPESLVHDLTFPSLLPSVPEDDSPSSSLFGQKPKFDLLPETPLSRLVPVASTTLPNITGSDNTRRIRKGSLYAPHLGRTRPKASSSYTNENIPPSSFVSSTVHLPSLSRMTNKGQQFGNATNRNSPPSFVSSVPAPVFIPRTPVRRRSRKEISDILSFGSPIRSPTKTTPQLEDIFPQTPPASSKISGRLPNALAFHPVPSSDFSTPRKLKFPPSAIFEPEANKADQSYYSSDGSPIVKDPASHIGSMNLIMAEPQNADENEDSSEEENSNTKAIVRVDERQARLRMMEQFGWRVPR